MKKIYFLCTGNSCRSQIAEGYGHKFLDPAKFEVRSAGIEAHGLNPRAIKVMAEDGIDITKQNSDMIENEYFNQADLIITLCGDARDKCPTIPSGVIHEHWDLEDPAKATGTEEEILSVFRETRETIKEKVKAIK
ncbi:arsenate reductase (thioredoxin) [Alkalibacterium sp. 20]|uniref:arsenate reductase (thioredoxin) n=1 Tax=Alkalibacterium sp. 20 TaxID=1798803 RepID=UPI0009003A7C|nr:arsenate reductase (thioredoxin) [Alkalibacterium sp. 20]OJF92190.1 arsenate reductase [Alkalibacterium sp. 20]